MLRDYVGRPTPLYEARRLSDALGGARILLKREDLAHTGAHKINNALGQALLAKRMGKRRVIAETGAGRQHGVATATACALMGLSAIVQAWAPKTWSASSLNVFRMQLLGATVRRVDSGSRTLKDAINEAMRDWVATVSGKLLPARTVLGPHPHYKVMSVSSTCHRPGGEGAVPGADRPAAGSRSSPASVAAMRWASSTRSSPIPSGAADWRRGRRTRSGRASMPRDSPAAAPVCCRARTPTSFRRQRQHRADALHSAGLDYAAVGPEHAWLHDRHRAGDKVNDAEALEAFQRLARTEGILPALESAHAVAFACRVAPAMAGDQILLVNLSGRGDKDVLSVQKASGAVMTSRIDTAFARIREKAAAAW